MSAFTAAEQKKHRAAFVAECRQKAWGALCNAEYIGRELTTIADVYESLRIKENQLGIEIDELKAAPDGHTYDSRMKRKGADEQREVIKQELARLATEMRQGQEAMVRLQASAENNLALARFADEWELKEIEPNGEKSPPSEAA